MCRIFSNVRAMKLTLKDPGNGPFGKYFFPCVLLAAAAVVLVLVCLPPSLQVQCLLRRWSGIPCPTCGGTRCVEQVLTGDLMSAFHTQPLVFLSVWAGGVVLFYLSIAGLVGWPVVQVRLERRKERTAIAVLLLILLLLNWIYLICRSG